MTEKKLSEVLDGILNSKAVKMEGYENGAVARYSIQVDCQGYTVSISKNDAFDCKGYGVFNKLTGAQVGIYKNYRNAKAKMEKMDLEHGSYRYYVKEIRG